MSPSGLISEAEAFMADNPEIDTVELLIPDMCGILRGKRLTRDGFAKLYGGGVRLPGSIYLLDATGRAVPTIPYGTADGDPDSFCHAVPATLKRVPWVERPMAQALGFMTGEDGAPLFCDPRAVLGAALAPLGEMGLTPAVAVELEFYLLDEAAGPDGRPQPAKSPATGIRPTTTQVYGMEELSDFDAFLDAIAAACAVQDIPAEAASSEYAPGQFEINLQYVADAVTACDQAVLLKRVIKAVARNHGMLATFMAKPFAELAGSGMHLHVSLLDGDGNNVFAEGHDADSGAIGERLGHAIGGLAEAMPESMAVFAPNANSFRRFQARAYAPVSPSWGVNNRSVALRVPPSDASSVRVEHRNAGADANPYLVCAAVLAGIHHGLAGKVAPPPMSEGGKDPDGLPALPLDWYGALDRFAAGAILPRYLGEKYHGLYAACRRFECDNYHARIQPLDYEWYLRPL